MSRHDYDLPADWPGMSSDERHEWLVQERCRRQAMRQDTPTAQHLEAASERYQRRASARAGRIDIESHR